VKAAVIAVLIAVSWLHLSVSQVSPVPALILVGIIAVQAWGGWVIWRWLRPSASFIEALGMAIAVGTALAALGAVLVRAVINTNVGWTLPAILGLILVVVARLRPQIVSPTHHKSDDRGVLGAVAAGITVGLAGLFISTRSYPLGQTSEDITTYHPDMLFFEAIGTSLVQFGPLDSIFTPDAVVRYHWLTYAWTGFLTDAAGAEPFVALTRVVPLLTLIASVLIAAAWTRRLTHAPWAPVLAVLLIVTGGYVGGSYGTILNFDSPSTALTTVWLMAGVLLSLQWADNRRLHKATLLLIGLISTATTAGKISTGFLLISALTVMVVFGLIRRAPWLSRAIALWIAAVIGAASAYLLFIFGSADPGGLQLFSLVDRASSVQGLNPIPGFAGAALGTAILALAVIPRWAGAAWFLRDPETRWSPTSGMALGLALGGILPLLLISGGVNETWFALAASGPLAVLSAGGIGRFVEQMRSSRAQGMMTYLLPSALVAAGLWIALWFLWSSGPSGGNVWEYTWRWAGPIVVWIGAIAAGRFIGRGLVIPYRWFGFSLLILVLVAVPSRLLVYAGPVAGSQPGTRGDLFGPSQQFTQGIDQILITSWTSDQVRAAEWIRQQTQASDLLATNITFSPIVNAYSQRQTYISGILFQAPYGWPAGIQILVEREQASLAFIQQPSSQSWLPLCVAGVRYLWVDRTRASADSWLPWADIAQAFGDTVILRVTDEGSAACS